MKNKIIIVESPKKAKTIQSMFPDYKVLSSHGSINQLISYDEDFNPKFIPNINGKNLLKELKNTKESDYFFIGTDSDREGEGIAYHISEILKKIKRNNISRLLFREISKKRLSEALDLKQEIDMNLVESQLARSMIDLMIGFDISKLMHLYLGNKSGAGRVQTIALFLIKEATDKKENFIPTNYFSVNIAYNNEIFQLKEFASEKEAKDFLNSCDKIFVSKKKEESSHSLNSIKPLKTTTLQQNAERIFNFSPTKTMQIAQELYEGKKIFSEETGLITYLRTDSLRISKEFLLDNKHIIESYNKIDFNQLNLVEENNLKVQDAHEAIRPINLNLTPEKIKEFLSEDEFKLYSLIFYSFIASCLIPPKYILNKTTFKNNIAEFKAVNSNITFQGYFVIDFINNHFNNISKHSNLNNLEKIIVDNFEIKEHTTKAPALWSESELIIKLEKLGIGRPSTYATIVPKLLEKDFILIENKRIKTTKYGKIASNDLKNFFSNIFNFTFTSELETKLDSIKISLIQRKDLLKSLKTELTYSIKEFKKFIDNLLSQPVNCFYCNKKNSILSGRYGLYLDCCMKYPINLDVENMKITRRNQLNFVFLMNLCEKCNISLCIGKKNSVFCITCKSLAFKITNKEYKIAYDYFFNKHMCYRIIK